MTATDLNTVRDALTYFDPKRFSVTINAARAALDRIEAELERARLISTPGGRSAAASSLELVAPGEQGLSYSWDDRDWQLTVELQQRRAEAAEAERDRWRAIACNVKDGTAAAEAQVQQLKAAITEYLSSETAGGDPIGPQWYIDCNERTKGKHYPGKAQLARTALADVKEEE